MPTWLVLALGALLVWGFWGLFFNLTSRHINSYSAIVWEVAGAGAVGLLVLAGIQRWSNLQMEGRGVLYGVLTGVSYTVGLALAFAALRFGLGGGHVGGTPGRVTTVLILTALYPLIAVILNAVLVSEPISVRQIIALGLGLAAVVILVTG